MQDVSVVYVVCVVRALAARVRGVSTSWRTRAALFGLLLVHLKVRSRLM